MTMFTRRSFLQTSALATGAALLARSTPSYARTIGANDRLRIAVVGLNGRGKSHISGWSEQKNVEIAYLIDPDQQVLERSLADLKKKAGQKFAAKGLSDLRRALEDPTLDAISIATPNHWHSLMTIWGAQLFFYSRVAHAIVYLAGLPVIRPLFWTVGIVGTVMIFLALFGVGA